MKKVCLACGSKDIQYTPFHLIPKQTKKPNQKSDVDFENSLIVNTLYCRDCQFVALEGLSHEQVDKNIKIISKMLENPEGKPSD